MPSFIHRMGLTWIALVIAAQASAQTGQPLTLRPENPPRWDVAAGFGILAIHRPGGDPGDPYGAYSWWDQRGEIRFDLGRYWTTHLKTEIGVSLPQTWTDFRCGDRIPVAGLPLGWACSSPTVDQRLTSVSPGFTYQFLENAFAHPFVSAGVRVGVQETHVHGREEVRTLNRISYTVPAIDRRTTTIRANPFLAAGFKSYFNDRAFVRSEALVALDSGRADEMTFRLGFGVDF